MGVGGLHSLDCDAREDEAQEHEGKADRDEVH